MPRRPQADTLEIVKQRGSYDEYPVLPVDKDPQVCLSRNTVAQPFFLICQFDTMLAQLAGEGRISFRDCGVRFFDMKQGDYAYIPAGVPHRYEPRAESIQYRYKAMKPGLEGVAWACPACDAEIHRDVWDTERELPQEGYLRATARFNGDHALRTCRACGAVHPTVDTSAAKWAEVAADLRAEFGGQPEAPAGAALTIAPSTTKQPMLANVYWVGRMANAQLVPMFPYLDPGSIVPCVSLFYGGEADPTGHFVHFNTVDEVMVNFGAVDSYIKPGLARVGTRTHGVGSRDKSQEPPNFAAINVITQRHPIGEAQREAVIFICHSCRHELAKSDFDGNPHPLPQSPYFSSALPTLATIIESANTAETYNRLGTEIACPECGTRNDVFPEYRWGWINYRNQTAAAIRSQQALAAATARVTAPAQAAE